MSIHPRYRSRFRTLGCIVLLLSSAACTANEEELNILWDGGFETGFGNTYWAADRHTGPNDLEQWHDGVLQPTQTIATRLYWLEDGDYTLCAWIRRAPAAESAPRLVLRLSNHNYYGFKERNVFSQAFVVPEGDTWQRVGWTVHIDAPVRRYFHVKLICPDQSRGQVLIGTNSTRPAWWEKYFDVMDPRIVDYISANSVLRPWYCPAILNAARKKGFHPRYYLTCGVGTKSPMRRTSLILDRPSSGGKPPAAFAWMALMHFWQSRPYGADGVEDGPEVLFGYYDLRALGQCIYLPAAGKTGVEFDNSPTLGLQAIAMLKYTINGKLPVRDATQPWSMEGYRTGTEGLFAFPFRDDEEAVVVLTTGGSESVPGDLANTWRFRGLDLANGTPLDLFAQPLVGEEDGFLIVRTLPLYVRMPADRLPQVLQTLSRVTAEIVPSANRHRLDVGPFRVDIDPERDGFIQLGAVRQGRDSVLIKTKEPSC